MSMQAQNDRARHTKQYRQIVQRQYPGVQCDRDTVWQRKKKCATQHQSAKRQDRVPFLESFGKIKLDLGIDMSPGF